ncbi:hypothetical protein ANTQUA_LOCUS2422 [Anthophora quadrimaculata]
MIAMKATILMVIPVFASYRLFFARIDAVLGGYYRFEIPTVPRFFDLRKPRVLKIMKRNKIKPAIFLDNLYRMMRGDPLLDENGNEIEEIGEDLSGPPHMEEAYKIMQEKGYFYYMPRMKV